VNPAQADLPADRPYRRNLDRVLEIRADWLDGRPDSAATTEMLQTFREGSPEDASAKAVELLNRGVAPRSLFDAMFNAAGELLMRNPGIISLHASTCANALHYAWQRCPDEQTRKLLLLQNAAFLPLYRRNSKEKAVRIDQLNPVPLQGTGAAAIEEIFAEVSRDRLGAAGKVLAYLRQTKDPATIARAARRLIFLKGHNSHDYKFSSAVLEDYLQMSPGWRDRFLAASVFNMKGSGDRDNDLVKRTRAALG